MCVSEKRNNFKTIYDDLNSKLTYAQQEKVYINNHLLSLQKIVAEKKSIIAGKLRSAAKTPTRLPSKYLSSEKLRKITKSKSPLSKVHTTRVIVSKAS